MPSNHLILCHSLLLLPSIFPSIRVFSDESVLHIRWPKYWSFSCSISPSNEYSGRISFRMDWLDLLAVQGTLKSLLQHCNSKASVLRCSVFLIVQLSHPYMTTEKTIASTRWTFVDKVMSPNQVLFYYKVFLSHLVPRRAHSLHRWRRQTQQGSVTCMRLGAGKWQKQNLNAICLPAEPVCHSVRWEKGWSFLVVSLNAKEHGTAKKRRKGILHSVILPKDLLK